MGQEPRKATDIVLELESKVNVLLDIVRAQDLNIKVLSNKLNDVMALLKKQAEKPKITVEAVQTGPLPASPVMPPGFKQLPAGDPERNVPIVAEQNLPQTLEPKGFRRTSRPETFAGDDAYLRKPGVQLPPQLPPQFTPPPPSAPQSNQQGQPPPGRSTSDIFVPVENTSPKKKAAPVEHQSMEPQPMPLTAQGQIPVMQRIVDKNGKSLFLADVEITDLTTSQPVFKTRTNGMGKWMASLGIGAYQVKLAKRATVGKEKLEAVQDIQIDGSENPLELPMLILK